MVASTSFPHLLSPGRIGSLELRNRILMCPMGDSLCEPDGSISKNQHAYFEARARGGAALLLVGSVAVSYPAGSYSAHQVAASEERFVDGLRELAERAHRHGARIAAQLVHDGAVALHDIAEGRPLLVPAVPPPIVPDRLSAMVRSAGVFVLPSVVLGRQHEGVPTALLEAVAAEKLQTGADVVALYNGIEAGENQPEPIDSLSVIHLGEHLERLSAQDLRKLDTQVPLETLRAVVDLATEIGREGRAEVGVQHQSDPRLAGRPARHRRHDPRPRRRHRGLLRCGRGPLAKPRSAASRTGPRFRRPPTACRSDPRHRHPRPTRGSAACLPLAERARRGVAFLHHSGRIVSPS